MTEALVRPPYARAALAYGLGLAIVEFALLFAAPSLFHPTLVADAAIGWLVPIAAFQGLRAVPFPPSTRWVALASLAAGHWLAVLYWLAT